MTSYSKNYMYLSILEHDYDSIKTIGMRDEGPSNPVPNRYRNAVPRTFFESFCYTEYGRTSTELPTYEHQGQQVDKGPRFGQGFLLGNDTLIQAEKSADLGKNRIQSREQQSAVFTQKLLPVRMPADEKTPAVQHR